jgi:transmembrane serine protease 11D
MPRRRTEILVFLTIIALEAVCSSQSINGRSDDDSEGGSKPLRRVVDAYKRGDSTETRLIGGADTTIEKNPWQVAIVAALVPQNSRAQFCGGSIIAPRWVLTAAHCVDGKTKPSQIAVLSGTASLTGGDHRVLVAPNGIIVHKDWNKVNHNFDIALIHVSSDLAGKAIKGMRSGEKAMLEDQLITVTGWGALEWHNSPGTIDLQIINVRYVPSTACNAAASYNGRITENMFCAGRKEGGLDACQGDSGGPASTQGPGGPELVGVVSWGEGCGFPKKYGVYTQVSQFSGWVHTNTGGAVQW